MKIIVGQRRSGRTTRLVELCQEDTASVLVVGTAAMKRDAVNVCPSIKDRVRIAASAAQAMRGCHGNMLLDMPQWFCSRDLFALLRTGFPVKAITLDPPEDSDTIVEVDLETGTSERIRKRGLPSEYSVLEADEETQAIQDLAKCFHSLISEAVVITDERARQVMSEVSYGDMQQYWKGLTDEQRFAMNDLHVTNSRLDDARQGFIAARDTYDRLEDEFCGARDAVYRAVRRVLDLCGPSAISAAEQRFKQQNIATVPPHNLLENPNYREAPRVRSEDGGSDDAADRS